MEKNRVFSFSKTKIGYSFFSLILNFTTKIYVPCIYISTNYLLFILRYAAHHEASGQDVTNIACKENDILF